MGSPSTTTSATRHHIGDRINIATRPVHARLNKSILERLPRALPPHATNPSLYASGLLHVAPIYLIFESLWKNMIFSDGESTTTPETDPPLLTLAEVSLFPSHSHTTSPPEPPACSPHIRAVLTHLHLPALLRSPSLLSDLRAITGWSAPELSAQLRLAAAPGRLAQFLEHTKRSVARRPHVLLAYAWVLYMALFSGGRFLRASLEDAGPAFWGSKSDPVPPGGCACCETAAGKQEAPLSFFRFATAEDGEDLKREFKMRLAEAEANLSEQEVADVVREAICLFDNMVLLVGQLDGVCGGEAGNAASPPQTIEEGWAAALMPKFLGGRIRDSLAVARERGLKSVGKMARVSGSLSPVERNNADATRTELLEKRAEDPEPGPVRTVRFGSEANGAVKEFDGRVRYASFSSALNAAVVVGVVGVVWGLGHVSR